MLNAKDAKAKSQKNIIDKISLELGRIETQINSATNNGLFIITVNTLSWDAKDDLERNGYKVEHFSDQREQLDYHMITWAE